NLSAEVNAIAESSEPGKHILIVDDDKGTRAVVSAALRRAGFAVTEAKDGKDALEKLIDALPDAVVCDLDMPGIGGKDFLVQVRGDERTAELPVIMLTGWDTEEQELSLIQSGASDFVSKSASPAVVVARIRRLVE
ncbi:MAG: response regulator, partial [Bdellovibrionales bacterium]|nr:response regulator [Bdellovibrionales bacterium]